MYGVFVTELGRLVWVATYDSLDEAKANHGPDSCADEECLIILKMEAFNQRLDEVGN